MTVSTLQASEIFLGNGVTNTFDFTFIGYSASSINVQYTNTSGVTITLLPSQYSVTLNAAAVGALWGIGGTITYPLSGSPISSAESLTVTRTLPLTQVTTISNQGPFAPIVTEQALDILCMEIQQIAARGGSFRGTWVTSTSYAFGDYVIDGANGAATGNYYMCVIANTSDVWADDLAAGDWTLIANVQGLTGYIPLSILGSKGDVVSASGPGAATVRTVGTNGQSLIADSTQTSGLNWQAQLPLAGGTLTGTLNMSGAAMNEAAWVDVAGATTTDIGAAASNNVRITGTPTIISFGTVAAGVRRMLRFADALTLTHNATSLILPSGANITTAANDTAIAISLGSGNWIVTQYQRANGLAVLSPGRLIGQQYFTTPGTATYTPTAGTASVIVEVWGAGGSGGVGTSSGAGCGSAGAYSRKRLTSAFSGVTITVGAGGASVTSGSNATGNNGGSSSFGAICSSSGGIAGTAGGAGPNIALVGASNLYGSISVGGTASGGDVNISGSCSYSIFNVGAAIGMGFGGAAPSGAAAGKSFTSNGDGTAGVFPGGGGTFAITGGSNSSGAGAGGMVLIWEYS